MIDPAIRQRDKDICRAYLLGRSLRDIAAEFRVSHETVRAIVRLYRLRMRPHNEPSPERRRVRQRSIERNAAARSATWDEQAAGILDDPASVERFVMARAEGISLHDIARLHGIDPRVVARVFLAVPDATITRILEGRHG